MRNAADGGQKVTELPRQPRMKAYSRRPKTEPAHQLTHRNPEPNPNTNPNTTGWPSATRTVNGNVYVCWMLWPKAKKKSKLFATQQAMTQPVAGKAFAGLRTSQRTTSKAKAQAKPKAVGALWFCLPFLRVSSAKSTLTRKKLWLRAGRIYHFFKGYISSVSGISEFY